MTSILARLRASRVFSVDKEGDDFEFVDGCDFCFGVTLTRDEVRALAAELVALVEDPKPWHETSLI